MPRLGESRRQMPLTDNDLTARFTLPAIGAISQVRIEVRKTSRIVASPGEEEAAADHT
jgi:hypothetical protein